MSICNTLVPEKGNLPIIIINSRKSSALIVLENNNHKKFGFPKGRKNNYESPKQAAYRELKEETGIDLNKIKYRTGGVVKRSNVVLYIIYVDQDPKIKIDRKEIIRYEWVNILDLFVKSQKNQDLYNRSIKAFTKSRKIKNFFRF